MDAAESERVVIANPADGGVLFWTAKLYGFAALFLVVALSVSGVCTYGHFANETAETPDWSDYSRVAPAVSRIVASDGTPLGEFASEWREVVPFEDIPEPLVQAFLAAEDHEFYEHNGIYFKGILRAAWRNVTAGDFAQGGSTITQQVAKQFSGSEKSLSRKIKEAILARRLERTYSKRAILSFYLNQIFLGNGAYGVGAAAVRYFSKRLDQLELAEMALIAGLAQAPSRYSPTRDIELATRRRNHVIDRMARYGFIDAAVAEEEKQKPIVLDIYRDTFGELHPYFAEHARRYVNQKYGPDFLLEQGIRVEGSIDPVADALAYENVRYGARTQDKRQGWRGPEAYLDSDKARDLFVGRSIELYGNVPLQDGRRYLGLVETVELRGAKVRVADTVYDLPIANMRWAHKWSATSYDNDRTIGDARAAIKVGDVIWVAADMPVAGEFRQWHLEGGVNPRWRPALSEERIEKLREQGKPRLVLEQIPHPQSAIFTADHETGYVVAMVGGTDATRSEYNRAVQACRQPGSTYKPIYYSAALDIGYGFDTALNDQPKKEVDPITGEVWTPTNFDGTVDRTVSLEYALVFSKNIPSVGIFSRVGADEVEKWARRLGFETEIIADKALALGASCTMLDQLARAFAIFARNGRWIDWVPVRRIVARDGNLLEDNTAFYDPMLPAADRLDRAAKTGGMKSRQAIRARTGYLINRLLAHTIEHGFASIVRRTGVIAAGKTGTSSATMDTSFVGYTSRWLTAVWLGDDMRERPLGKSDAAYMTVVPIWARFMAEAAVGHPNKKIPWEVPDGVDENDRGDHSKGGRHRMPLVYKKKAKPPWARDEGGEEG